MFRLAVALGMALMIALGITGEVNHSPSVRTVAHGMLASSTHPPDRVVIQRVILYPATIAQHPSLWHHAYPRHWTNSTPSVVAVLYASVKRILATGHVAEATYMRTHHGIPPAYSCPAGMAMIKLAFFEADRQVATVDLGQTGCAGETLRLAGQHLQTVGPLGIGRPYRRLFAQIAAAASLPLSKLLPRWATLPYNAP